MWAGDRNVRIVEQPAPIPRPRSERGSQQTLVSKFAMMHTYTVLIHQYLDTESEVKLPDCVIGTDIEEVVMAQSSLLPSLHFQGPRYTSSLSPIGD
jgi:hypothetical protein